MEAGFEEHQIVLSKYIIRFIFTSVYKNNFLLVFKKNETFIKNNICKIFNDLKENNTNFNLLIDEDEIEIKY